MERVRRGRERAVVGDGAERAQAAQVNHRAPPKGPSTFSP
jgi:hypothetical protein